MRCSEDPPAFDAQLAILERAIQSLSPPLKSLVLASFLHLRYRNRRIQIEREHLEQGIVRRSLHAAEIEEDASVNDVVRALRVLGLKVPDPEISIELRTR